jgi:hypothetical protein
MANMQYLRSLTLVDSSAFILSYIVSRYQFELRKPFLGVYKTNNRAESTENSVSWGFYEDDGSTWIIFIAATCPSFCQTSSIKLNKLAVVLKSI